MNIRNYESRATHLAWSTGSGSPAFMVLACLVVNFIALIVTVIINTTVVKDGHNDYNEGYVLLRVRNDSFTLTFQLRLVNHGSSAGSWLAVDTRRCCALSLLGPASDLLSDGVHYSHGCEHISGYHHYHDVQVSYPQIHHSKL
jgi:hypothetical protein